MPFDTDDLFLSPKDREAPTLAQASDRGILPTWDAATAFTHELSTRWAER
jgi:dTDP-4-dehydrorhamnose 3,5-epimerase